MKLKKELYLRNVCGEYILVPVGKTVEDYNGLFNLTESGAMIFQGIESGKEKEEILAELLDTFDVDEETARRDISEFIATLEQFGIL